MDEGNGIKVDSGELLSTLECSVCCSEYTDPLLTRCGHTFCRDCIEECINRNHECPECKRTLTKEDLAKNIQIERIQRQIRELYNKAKNEIVESVLALEGGFSSNKSPIMSIFQANLKDQLVRFERLCDDVKRECEETKKKVRTKYAGGLKGPENLQLKQEEANADKRCAIATEYLLKTYDRYMKESLVGPQLLPVALTVHVPHKDVKLDSVSVKPNEPIREVRLAVEKYFKDQHNPILRWDLNMKYVIHTLLDEEVKVLSATEEMKSLSEVGVFPGSRVELNGTFLCESDVPKPCITLKFRKEEGKMYDYYSCETCSLNWICEPCIQQCHKGHTCKLYLKNHVPTWACCYCTKKGCKLPNKNNPLGSGVAMSVPQQ
eukprot:TRINITY_DN1334_c0_g1_i1.p2 TRINITY_DN1334_c0_g1~~TRINITY_DN1334_c0_g1_i1.p2  ORF type:complete len:404 (+),score=25.01 TRINITY_DN1334_c0_g1_i1:83-1213(+)